MLDRLAWSLVALGAALASVACNDGASPRRPDVVLIVVDTLRADRLSTYGYERETSPFLDRLAEEGTVFEDATAQSSWTLPSMVSLFTGHYLTDYRDFIDDDTPTLPEAFRRAGYRSVGIAGNILLTESGGFSRGFQRYDASPESGGSGMAPPIEELLERLEAPLAEALATDADGSRPPVFLYLHPFDPHDPYDPYAHRPELAREVLAGADPDVGSLDWQRWRHRLQGPSAPEDDPHWTREWTELARQRDLYDLGVRHTDDYLSDAFDDWRARGLLDDAIVAFVSDHGEGLWDHVDLVRPRVLAEASPKNFFYQEHGSNLYQEGVHTPFVLWGRGVPRGQRIDVPVENVDLFPTLLELAGLAAPGPLHGHSLVPLMSGEPPPREAIHSYILHGLSVREIDGDLKLVEPTPLGIARADRPVELYELAADPAERWNVAAQRSDDVTRLTARLREWQARYPTVTTFGQRPDPKRAALLEKLGYTGEHTGEVLDPQ